MVFLWQSEMHKYQSWGKNPHAKQTALYYSDRHQALPVVNGASILPYGMGRSYGDVCLNDENAIIPTSRLDHYMEFDQEKGVIKCEAGVCLSDLLDLVIPRGYFIPVTPGTKNVTIGGMVANDVHGKNHHRAGSFGNVVMAFELLRSDGKRLICTPDKNPDLYRATIGGLGLTGLITWVEISLETIESAYINTESIRFQTIEDFFRISDDSDQSWEYTVAWIDAFSNKSGDCRGVFFRGNHMRDNDFIYKKRSMPLGVPLNMPSWLLNRYVLKLFNKLYYSVNRNKAQRVHIYDFFYPLDKVSAWNKMYGKNGFYQYQCVIPDDQAEMTIRSMLKLCNSNKQGSFLSVLKKFGDIKSPGLLSFPKKGYTLALDFPNRGKRTLNMLDAFDDMVLDAGGSVYPAKDARMSADSFKCFFPAWQEFSQQVDRGFSSSFWRRVMAE